MVVKTRANKTLERTQPLKIKGITHCRLCGIERRAHRAFTYQPPAQGALEILHHDDDVLVLTKPAGLLSVPGKDPAHFDCVEYRIQQQYREARIVHRLDLATSGIMVMAMNSQAHRHLGLQFERRKVRKQYVARIGGRLIFPRGLISLPMRCDWPNRPIQMVDYEHGRRAETAFEVIDATSDETLVRLVPETGRSHQLRLHLAELGHPILGDSFYADDALYERASRLLLHAEKLAFFHPTGGRAMIFESPADF